jgi:hypothetical protein
MGAGAQGRSRGNDIIHQADTPSEAIFALPNESIHHIAASGFQVKACLLSRLDLTLDQIDSYREIQGLAYTEADVTALIVSSFALACGMQGYRHEHVQLPHQVLELRSAGKPSAKLPPQPHLVFEFDGENRIPECSVEVAQNAAASEHGVPIATDRA